MHVIICGAGQVGRHLVEVLSEQGHNVTILDTSSETLRGFDELADIRTVHGSACHAGILREAGIHKCYLLVAATNQDEINLLSATIARHMGAHKVVARVHHRAYLDRAHLDYSRYLDIDHVICPEFMTAQVIARNLLAPGAMVIERFAHGKIELQQYEVNVHSNAIGIKLSDLNLPAGVRLAAIERKGDILSPQPTSVLRAGDVIKIIGETRHSGKLQQLFLQQKPSVKRIVIMGGSSMAVWLSRALDSRFFSIRLFEPRRARAEELSSKLRHVTVIQGDPTDPTLFHEEHVAQCDAFVAVSENDEHNIIGAVQAKEMGARSVVVVTAQQMYLRLLAHIGVDQPYSPRLVAAKEILRLIDDTPVRRAATLAEDIVVVYELDPAASGTAIGKSLKDIRLPQKGAFVAAVQRKERVFVPGADDIIADGDILIVIGPAGMEKKLRALFIGD